MIFNFVLTFRGGFRQEGLSGKGVLVLENIGAYPSIGFHNRVVEERFFGGFFRNQLHSTFVQVH